MESDGTAIQGDGHWLSIMMKSSKPEIASDRRKEGLPRRLQFDISIFIESLEYLMEADHVIRALAALAQEHRLAVFRLLVQAGAEGLAAGVLAERIGVPPSSMSFHLTQLANAGLVTQRRESRSIIYSADYAAMNGLMGYLTENCCGGVPCGDAGACQPDPARPDPERKATS
jgi:Predicted transcriptional regulators